MSRPRIVQHSFGSPGTGGPIGALTRLLRSDVGQSFHFLHVKQAYPAGGVNLRLIFKMAKQMRAFQPDIAHIRGLGNEGFHGVVAARLAGVPEILVSVHGSVRDLVSGPVGLRRWALGSVLEPLTLRFCTHVITVCEDALEKPILKRSAHKIVGVVPNGVDLVTGAPNRRSETRRTLSIGVDDLVLIVVGRLVIDKGGFDLLEALRSLPADAHESAIHLLVVGDGPDRELFSARAESVPHVLVHVLGLRHDVSELLNASDVAVLPSWHENMSNALLEAMAAGLPVIATSVGGNTEVLTKGGGILVPPRNPPALASAILMLIRNSTQRATLGRQARAVITADYTTEHMARRLAEVYHTILER